MAFISQIWVPIYLSTYRKDAIINAHNKTGLLTYSPWYEMDMYENELGKSQKGNCWEWIKNVWRIGMVADPSGSFSYWKHSEQIGKQTCQEASFTYFNY
jgi:hypothetical protein